MERRDFIKRVGIYPLAIKGLATALTAGEPVIRAQGERQVLELSGVWQLRMAPALC